MQVVLKKSINKDKDGKIVNEKIVEFANRGYRALGVSRCNEMVRSFEQALLGTTSVHFNRLPCTLRTLLFW